MSLPHKVDELLDPDAMKAFEAFLRDKRRTVTAAHDYLLAQGYRLSRAATGNWLAAWRIREERWAAIDRSSAAKELAEALKKASPGDLTQAASEQLNQHIFLLLARARDEDQESALDAGELMKLGIALKGGAAAELAAQKVRADERKRQAEAVEAASKVAASGGDGSAVLDTLKQALGITGEAPA